MINDHEKSQMTIGSLNSLPPALTRTLSTKSHNILLYAIAVWPLENHSNRQRMSTRVSKKPPAGTAKVQKVGPHPASGTSSLGLVMS